MTEQTPDPVNEPQRETVGVLLVDKPVGRTSFAVVKKIRRLLGIKKVGHAGTLDPFAGGLLVICVGRPATRNIDAFMAGRKTYQAELQLGRETETQDPEGEITAVRPVPRLALTELAEQLQEFIGPQMQAPPPYSAAKHKGKPLYHYARKGIIIQKKAKPIEIYSLNADEYDPVTERLSVTVSCSRGTYIRVLAADIGTKLGCGAHLAALRRTRSGGFSVDDALDGKILFTGDDRPDLPLNGMLTVEQALERHQVR